jgi:hypothetical protein
MVKTSMMRSQPSRAFLVACAATVLLTMLGLLYLAGDALLSSLHEERALVCFAFAMIAACIASLSSPRRGLG